MTPSAEAPPSPAVRPLLRSGEQDGYSASGTTSPCTFSMNNQREAATSCRGRDHCFDDDDADALGRHDALRVRLGPDLHRRRDRSSSPGNVGTVTFKSGATTICSAVPISSGTATCSPARLPVGPTASGRSTAEARASRQAPVTRCRRSCRRRHSPARSRQATRPTTATPAPPCRRDLSRRRRRRHGVADRGTATFDNKLVGTGKTVALSGAALSGTDAGNYSLGSVSNTTANIMRGP